MNTSVFSQSSFEAGWVGHPKATGVCSSFELVKAFGDRIYSIAKHITQDDHAAGDVVIETFLEACPDWDGCPEDEVWLRLVTIAVRAAFSKLHNRGEGIRFLNCGADPYHDLAVHEISVWGENYQQRDPEEWMTRLLEHGLQSLDPMCRTVFLLRDIEEISAGQIASIVNRSVAVVAACLRRARLQLREILTQQMRQQQ